MQQAQEVFDVVIVGSGLGGLVCAAILAKEGKRVCVLEKNEQIGGVLQTFQRDGVTFDTGVHYIGALDKGQNLHRLFTYLGIMERLELERLDEEGYDVIAFEGEEKTYRHGIGYDNFSAILLSDFPEEEKAITKYCNDMRELCASVPFYNIHNTSEQSEHPLMYVSCSQYFDELTTNDRLRAVLAGTNLLYAGVRGVTPFFVHALVVNSYIESAYRCADGGDRIAKLLARVIREHGGEIHRKKEVTKLADDNGVLTHALCADGSTYHAHYFISNANPAATLTLTDSKFIRPAYRERINTLVNTPGAFMIYAVMEEGTFPYLHHNYYYFDCPDVWHATEYNEAEWPYHYALFCTAPPRSSKWAESICIMCYLRSEEVAQWSHTINTTLHANSRGETYEQFKERKAQQVFETVEKKFPELRSKVKSYYTSTPLSYRDYMGTQDGTMYGYRKDSRDPLGTYISPRTKVPNLLLTGQNINVHGVLGVTESAFITCFYLLGREFLVNRVLTTNGELPIVFSAP